MPTPEERYGIEGLNWKSDLQAPNAPRQLAAMLAAYQLAGNLMTGQCEVGEIGLAHALGTRLMVREVERLRMYDPRMRVVDELQRQFSHDPTFEAQCHDLVCAPTPQQLDAIYSIDFIKYLTRDEEDAFIGNLRASLRNNFAFALIGCPSFGGADSPAIHGPAAFSDNGEPSAQLFLSLPDVGPASTTAQAAPLRTFAQSTATNSGGPRIYRRSGEELGALMRRYFHNVFAFSLIEQTVQPGIHPNSQHVFALGCGKKTMDGIQRSTAGRDSPSLPPRR